MEKVERHYGREGLADMILQALRDAGRDLDRLTEEHLAPADHFHLRGRDATLELARLAAPTASTRILDVGGGLGGPARTLASHFGCRVSVLDLTPEYCRAGQALTERVRLADRVTFHVGDALELPFPDESFDLVWTQHSSMNIPDKQRLYQQIRRVLRPGGRLALHEIMGGAGPQPVHFPVPWADGPDLSHLRPAAEHRALIAQTGFAERAWIDLTAPSLAWLRERAAAASPAPVGLHLLLGDKTRPAMLNMVQNLTENRIAVIMALFERA